MAKKKSKAKKRPVAKTKRTVVKKKATKKIVKKAGKASLPAKSKVKPKTKAKAKAKAKKTPVAAKPLKKPVKRKPSKPRTVVPTAPLLVAETTETTDHVPASEPVSSDVESAPA